MGRFGTPEVVHTDRGTAFHNELVSELLRMTGTEQSLSTVYSCFRLCTHVIVERANQEILRHLNAILFDTQVHDKWSFEQLPMVQRIMNTVEKTSTGVSPAELILNNRVYAKLQIGSFDEASNLGKDNVYATGSFKLEASIWKFTVDDKFII